MSHLNARVLEVDRASVMNTSSSDIVDASASLLDAKASLGLNHLSDNLDSRLTAYLSYSCRYNRRNVCVSVNVFVGHKFLGWARKTFMGSVGL